MTDGERLLTVLGKDGYTIVVEFSDLKQREEIVKEAESKGMKCKSISMEDFYPAYRGHRYFDLRNPTTRESFSLDYLLHSWEMDQKHSHGGEVDEWFIH